MKIKIKLPPNIEQIRQHFELHKGIVFCYGDTLFNPDNGYVDPALMAHESTHSRQQAEIGVKKWWDLYCVNIDFRASQEIEAYQNQYKVLQEMFKDRNTLNVYLNRLAKDLSSEMYGNVMSFGEARKAIRAEQKFSFDLSNLK